MKTFIQVCTIALAAGIGCNAPDSDNPRVVRDAGQRAGDRATEAAEGIAHGTVSGAESVGHGIVFGARELGQSLSQTQGNPQAEALSQHEREAMEQRAREARAQMERAGRAIEGTSPAQGETRSPETLPPSDEVPPHARGGGPRDP